MAKVHLQHQHHQSQTLPVHKRVKVLVQLQLPPLRAEPYMSVTLLLRERSFLLLSSLTQSAGEEPPSSPEFRHQRYAVTTSGGQLTNGCICPDVQSNPPQNPAYIKPDRINPTALLTFAGFARSMTWVMAAGGWMGLNGDSSVPEGGWSFTFMDCK